MGADSVSETLGLENPKTFINVHDLFCHYVYLSARRVDSICEEHQKMTENVSHSFIMCVCQFATEDKRVGTGYKQEWKVTEIHSPGTYTLVICIAHKCMALVWFV